MVGWLYYRVHTEDFCREGREEKARWSWSRSGEELPKFIPLTVLSGSEARSLVGWLYYRVRTEDFCREGRERKGEKVEGAMSKDVRPSWFDAQRPIW